MIPDVDSRNLDGWLGDPSVRVAHRLQSSASPEQLWRAAQSLCLRQTRVLGRLIRWRIPDTSPSATFHDLFSGPPFLVLAEDETSLVSGLAGRIWTLRRDYPQLEDGDAFREWSRAGTARVLFANWVAPGDTEGSVRHSETRVEAFGARGRLGLASLRPLIRSAHSLIATDALAAAVRAAERS